MRRGPRYARRPQAEIQEDTRDGINRSRGRAAAIHTFWREVIDTRLREVVFADLGGPATASKRSGIPRSTISSWFSKVKEGPALYTLRELSKAADVSLDWLCGHDVPKRRTDREMCGDLRRELRAYVVKEIPETRREISARRANQVVPASDRLLNDVVKWIGGRVAAVQDDVARGKRAEVMAAIRSDLERDNTPEGRKLLQAIQQAVSENPDPDQPAVVEMGSSSTGSDDQVARRAAELALNIPSEGERDSWSLAEALEYFRALAQANPGRVAKEWPEFLEMIRQAYERAEDRMDVLSGVVVLKGFTWPAPEAIRIRRHAGRQQLARAGRASDRGGAGGGAERSLPVWIGQEVQEVSRGGAVVRPTSSPAQGGSVVFSL
jgi:transcriptional regulator with XRE-family HTH domain